MSQNVKILNWIILLGAAVSLIFSAEYLLSKEIIDTSEPDPFISEQFAQLWMSIFGVAALGFGFVGFLASRRSSNGLPLISSLSFVLGLLSLVNAGYFI